MDLVFRLIEIYGLIDPVTDDTVGAFNDPELDDLLLHAHGVRRVSLVAALIVGATIEDMDLADLYELIDFTDNDHLQLVAYNLAKGSRNHLRAFIRALGAQGETYERRSTSTRRRIRRRSRGRHGTPVFFNADGEPVPACGADAGGFGVRRGPARRRQWLGNGECDGTGSGDCDGTGSSNGGRRGGSGNGERHGSGTCDGTEAAAATD